MNDWQLKAPVAFFIFNRPDTTEKVFEAIRQAKPTKLLVVADGPRADRPGEVEKCAAARAIIARVDWDCKVLKNYSDVNQGCKLRVSSGLDWVFDTVEESIILEDDCFPHPTFFRFCEELLEKYRVDTRIMMISGSNIVDNSMQTEEYSYFFSKYPHIWGWASWRRAWNYYDADMSSWPKIRDSKVYLNFSSNKSECLYWKRGFDNVHQGKVDTWDAQVTYMFFCQSSLAVFPNKNMISNIGFNPEATHTKGQSNLSNLKISEMDFPLKHPDSVIRDIGKDEIRRKIEYTLPSFSRRLLRKLASSQLLKKKRL